MTNSDVALATPPTAASTASLLGYPVADWVLWLNLLYISGILVWKIYKETKEYINGRRK